MNREIIPSRNSGVPIPSDALSKDQNPVSKSKLNAGNAIVSKSGRS